MSLKRGEYMKTMLTRCDGPDGHPVNVDGVTLSLYYPFAWRDLSMELAPTQSAEIDEQTIANCVNDFPCHICGRKMLRGEVRRQIMYLDPDAMGYGDNKSHYIIH
jgi:hypothetical protein